MSRALRENLWADTATRQMLNKPPLPFTKGLRLGNMPQIRVIVDEELESVWTGKKTPQQALDTAVERGNQLLRRFEIDEVLISVMSDAFRLSDPASRVGRISEAHPAQFRINRNVIIPSGVPLALAALSAGRAAAHHHRYLFIWPAGEALWYSLQSVDPFGFSSQFVGLDNFVTLFHDSYYLDSFWTTIKFSTFVTVSGLLVSLFFAALVEYIVRGSRFYQTLMLLPYAVAPAVAAVLWIFLFNPGRGLITHFLAEFGYDWNHAQNSGQAMFLVVFASVWKQISYNFLFFYAALQSIPRSLIEAAAIDGAGPIRRFFKIALPLIAPVSFFLLVVNTVYAFFDTFPVIDAATSGGPVQATTTLIYKIYREGFTGLDLASSAAQSVVLMFLVIVLTVVQFRYVESKVRYQ